MNRVVALVVAAGRGRRFGGDIPKQYLDLGGRPVLRHSLAALAANPQVTAVRAVIHPDDRDLYDACAQGLDLLEPVAGGETRQDSVRLGLESLAGLEPQAALIHDGARPFLDGGIVARVIGALAEHPGAIPAIAVADTLKRGADGLVAATVERAGLWRAQTPQGFRFADILAAHRACAGHELTDDAAVAERAGLAVALVEGSEDNVKITTAADLERGRRVFQGPGEFRTATGFDVHRFAPGTGVWLCGVLVPHDSALDGHSDADVAMHALTDALLGTIAAGDIGHHFPPSDPRWKGVASRRFLAHAAALVAGLGGRIVNVDVTILCERPKIGPHRAAMQSALSEILGLAHDRVGIKATTTEGLGFTGRREGIAAQASATVWLPR
ncbi:bifunctional 2-C-methyl-D-erythritol 4-phosphate cytidylyltransferase/2-C-methyl-D-erythritol 2,4-cyclodiphosphate synthase [Magnetospirillum sp. UT-4]|uniref:bifunctional 2-C-methyl-D-erythritol 4-phosphate cytidylyltransferase/2-C-methyl-D-erythritol 2,4-cyclodiphosphate synthase n=1 Tax=Magnetospirillum sp. UT-4 TaxID=2681467 RepID=UPI0013860844|nr:bifunctional 2-C-methyl-D-erythritol 4-phosphate cytidylyltransferase/2-C-methyl-D-erythritol 2,4-cyclodiphosphate synthase [Magnetospirillum sp. UT-4]CAA7617878.1 Bifunctional enzyme IspD/IspF (Includes: 2-C-methyl-D-erythritol 4-phosphate cytidylyltransferase; 2-C-methyl-D-erythritol 2,4-cyclodiphosphate synthase) [Magnetospirillum sp. UT-4]